jgi:hypothetical protein
MRALILAVFLVGTVAAETPDMPSERVTFTRSELDSLEAQFEGILSRREAEAFQRGQQDVRERCPALVRLI